MRDVAHLELDLVAWVDLRRSVLGRAVLGHALEPSRAHPPIFAVAVQRRVNRPG
ncbi:hypothetical protein ACFPRL_11675 [Pseudoclavibacter helvolus]